MIYNKTALPELISIKSIISIFRNEISWPVPPDHHYFYEISYVERQDSHTLIDGVPLVIKEGQLIIFAPNSVHESDKDYRVGTITLNNVCFEGDIGRLYKHMNRPISLTGAQQKHILEIVRLGAAHFERAQEIRGMIMKPGTSEYELKRLKNELELFLISVIESLEGAGDDIASNTKNHISESFAELNSYLIKNLDKNLTTEDMASAISVSTSTLKNICHSGASMSPTAYFINLKMKRAKELIKGSSMNFTEIAEKLGFSSVHYFSKLFKSKIGMTPTEYAKSKRSSL